MTFRRKLTRPIKSRLRSMAGRLRIRLAGSAKARTNMRRFLKTFGGMFAYAAFVEPRWIETTQVEIQIRDLPHSLDGYRIAHLTDVHFSFAAGIEFIRRVVDITNTLDADMVALTGDFIAKRAVNLHRCLSLLGDIKAPDGLWATRGNHDHKASLEDMRLACREADINFLENSHVVLRPARARGEGSSSYKESIVVAGVGDLWMGPCSPGLALQGAPTDRPTVLLSHNPQAVELLSPSHRVDIALSGHTHGGQFRPWGRTLSVLSDGSTRFASGLIETTHTRVYVSRGVGNSAFHIRWNCRPEIALITLVRA